MCVTIWVFMSLPGMMQPPDSSPLSSSWQKMAGCFSWNEVVIVPHKNGLTTHAVAIYRWTWYRLRM